MDAGHRTELERPAWAREALAWIACLANALPVAVVLIAAWGAVFGRPSPLAATWIYGAVFSAWVAAFRPWSKPRV